MKRTGNTSSGATPTSSGVKQPRIGSMEEMKRALNARLNEKPDFYRKRVNAAVKKRAEFAAERERRRLDRVDNPECEI